MEGRGKSRRRSPYRVWKRRGSALLAVLMTLSLMLGDISGLSRVVMAGQGTVREEFRIHREDILKAAEEAIENGEPLSEPLAITSEEEKTEEKYQEILPADGSVYEIFPDIEQVKEVDSLELRIFIRLAEGADPASYTLTGDETLVFLYVNGGDVTAEGRINIDGYVSEFTKVAAFEGEEEPMQPGGDTGAAPGNGAAGSGNGSGNGAAGSSGNAGDGTETAESESNGSGSMDPEDSAADLDGETEAESEEAGDETSEDGMNPEETLPAETQEPESSAAEETEEAEQPSGQTPDDETPGDQTDGSEADGTASDKNTAEAGTGSADEDKETAGNTENSGAEDNGTDNESNVNESDAADDASEGNEGSAEDNSQADPADTENENAEADKEDGAEPEKSDTEENADSNAADEDNGTGGTVTLSLRNIQKVAASLASPSEADKPEADESQEEQEESEADEEDSYYEDNGDPVDEEDAAEAEDEEDIFKKTHDLKGRKYDEAVLDETVAVRAFAAGMEDAGFNREDLLEGAHRLTYTVAEGEARLIYTPEYVRDEAVVTFGIIPAEGMEVYQVTANGEALAETEETAAIASASQAKRAKASSSDADYDEERAVYYQIPQVLEDQAVEIQVVEEGYNDHPAFLQSRTVNGVTVTVSAEEGILPAGTELSVEEVTEQVADAVAEKVEAEAGEDSGSDAEELAESEQGEGLSITQVFAYDINLMLDGKKLNNDWGETDVVTVKFSGERIEEASKGAEKIEIATLETPTKTVEAALGGTEEMPVVDHLTADNIELNTEGRQAIEISGDEGVREIKAEVSHFTVYTLVFGENTAGRRIKVEVVDENGTDIGEGRNTTITLTSTSMKVLPIAMEILDRDSMSGYYFTRAYVYENGQQVEVRQMRYTEEDVWYEVIRPVGGSERIRAGEEDVYFEFSQNTEITFSANGGTFPGGVTEITANLSSDHTCSDRIPDPSMDDNTPEDGTDNLEFKGWVFGDTNFEFGETPVCSGGTVYALYGVKDDSIESFQENQSLTAHTGEGDPAGTVHQSKQAEWENYEEGIAKVTLTVDGVPGGEGVDVVIVLDKSGSMSPRLTNEEYPERMNPAKEAAMEVISNLLEDPAANNRVAFVPYACGNKRLPDATQKDNEYYPNTHTNDSVGFQTAESEGGNHYLADAIKATDAFGGTCYSDGLNKAYEFIAGSGNYTTEKLNRKAYIIFISDGVPNSNYDNDERIYDARTNLVNRECLKGIYTVGIQMTEQQSGTLKNIVYQGTYSDVSDPDELSGVLSNIAGEIQNAGTNAWFVDEIASDYFTKLTSEELNEYELENSSNVYYETHMRYMKDNVWQSVVEDEVVVNIGEITSAVKTYSFYLKVKDPDLLNQEWEKPTNNSITLTYTDINNIHQTVEDQRSDTDETIEIGKPTLERYAEPFVIQKLFDKDEDPSQLNQVEFTLQKIKDYAGNQFSESQSVVTLSAVGDMFNAGNLGLGTYEVREVKTANGYQILEHPIEVVIGLEQDYSATGDKVAVEYSSEYPSGEKSMLESTIVVKYNGAEVTQQSDPVSVSGEGKGAYVVNNQSMPKLPETGGPGFIMMERFGWMLLLMAMLGVEVQMLSNRKKRR